MGRRVPALQASSRGGGCMEQTSEPADRQLSGEAVGNPAEDGDPSAESGGAWGELFPSALSEQNETGQDSLHRKQRAFPSPGGPGLEDEGLTPACSHRRRMGGLSGTRRGDAGRDCAPIAAQGEAGCSPSLLGPAVGGQAGLCCAYKNQYAGGRLHAITLPRAPDGGRLRTGPRRFPRLQAGSAVSADGHRPPRGQRAADEGGGGCVISL